MNYVWAILANNADFLRLQLRKAPRYMVHMQELIVVTNSRLGMADELRAVVEQEYNHVASTVMYDDRMIAECRKELDLQEPTEWDAYVLNVKMALPWYLAKQTGVRVSYVDDDALILRDPVDIVCRKELWGNKSGLAARYSWDSGDHVLQVEALADVFDLGDYDIDDYHAARTSAGSFTFDPSDIGPWIWYLRKFWEHPYFASARERGVPFRSSRWLWDQRFLTAYFAKRGSVYLTRRMKECQHFPKKFPKAQKDLQGVLRCRPAFVHYNAGSWKNHYVQWFMNNVPESEEAWQCTQQRLRSRSSTRNSATK